MNLATRQCCGIGIDASGCICTVSEDIAPYLSAQYCRFVACIISVWQADRAIRYQLYKMNHP